MPTGMTATEARAFLAHGTRTAKLATTRNDGRPHVAPVWFVLDGDDVLFMTNSKTVKGRTLQRQKYAALAVDLEEPPYAFVLVEGSVTISGEVAEMLPYSIEIARRYMGDERADEYGRRNAVEGELLVRLHPERVIAVDNMAGH